MINISKKMKSNEFKSNMLIQVHDELIFEIHNSEIELMRKLITEEMENAYALKVPLSVDIGIGDNWFDAH